MFQQLLVPIDDTPLADVTVAHALRFARSTGARVTFFHAAPDLAATDEGVLLYTMDRSAFADESATQGQAALLRARTAAEIAGVPCQTLARIADHPAQAIHDTAHAQGCDLIFLSSHGRIPGWRGWLRSSVTQRLLEITDLPVLVAGVESNQVDADKLNALGVMNAEHRSIAAVVRGLQQTVREARADGGRLDNALMRQMLAYLRAFPERLHHPKEETHLFRLLRQRSHEVDALLDELERQHAQESELVDSVAAALDRYDSADRRTLEDLCNAVQRLAGAVWEHMNLEETQIFPAAMRHLLPEDWKAVAVAFTTHIDPLRDVDSSRSLADTFARIATALLAAPTAQR
jgi:nucleotide-binding universal stress UspA family protein/hemerythrin-like domain-containing protein